MIYLLHVSTRLTLQTEEFIAHGDPVNCVAFGRKSGGVFVTGGDDRKVNVWAVGKPNAVMVSKQLFMALTVLFRACREMHPE